MKPIFPEKPLKYLSNVAFTSALSSFIRFVYALFNGIFGIAHKSLWNGSICVYYILLSLVRALIVHTLKKSHGGTQTAYTEKVYFWSHFLLILMNLSLIVPIAVMVRGGRTYSYGLIPAIALAAYTTYRIVSSAIQFKRSRKDTGLLVSALRAINLIDALVAIMTLQNTLIQANGGMTPGMKLLTAGTNAGLLGIIIAITVLSFCKLRTR